MKAKYRDGDGKTIRLVRANLKLHPEMYRSACALAQRLGKSFTDLVCDLIEARLKKEK